MMMQDSNPAQDPPRTRVSTACNRCRSKKIRCNGPFMPDNRCSSCVMSDKECVYTKLPKNRKPTKDYVRILETRLNEMEHLMHTRFPGIDLGKELGELDKSDKDGQEFSMVANSADCKPNFLDFGELDEAEPSDRDSSMLAAEHQLFIDLGQGQSTFIGKSSSVGLFRTILGMKYEQIGVEDLKKMEQMYFKNLTQRLSESSWLPYRSLALSTIYQYPEPELLSRLVNAFFEAHNLDLPVLHRPIFEKALSDGVHLHVEEFGAVVIMVCCLGSLHLDLAHNESLADKLDPASWFHQVHLHRRLILVSVTLSEIQVIILASIYLLSVGPAESAWILVGIGIRLCQEAGAHRRSTNGASPTCESESWKRVFWCLVVLERSLSCILGRQCTLREEDYDLNLPIECDDEYWLHPDPTKAFRQPPGKPSTSSYFIVYLKQIRILGRVLRTLYSNNKTKAAWNMLGPEKEKMIVADLDSALNRWISEVPDHLKWNPNRGDSVFARQSGCLYASYYHLQILVHRPFVTSALKSSPSSTGFPSLLICANAARLCSKLVDVCNANYDAVSPCSVLPMFTSGIILLLNIWCTQLGGRATDLTQDIEDLNRCIKALKGAEKRWCRASDLRRILVALASANDIETCCPLINKLSKPNAHGTKASYSLKSSFRGFPSLTEADLYSSELYKQTSREQAQSAEQPPPPPPMSNQGPPPDQEDSSPLSYEVSDSFGAPTEAYAPMTQSQSAVLQQSPVYAFEGGVYDEMMLNFGNVLGTSMSEVGPTLGDSSDLVAVEGMSALQIDDEAVYSSNYNYDWPGTYTADAVDLMSTIPSSFQYDEWDSYTNQLMSGAESSDRQS